MFTNPTNTESKKPPFKGVQIAGFYEKQKRATGETYMASSRCGNARYLLLPNAKRGQKNERGFNEPDFLLFAVPFEEQNQSSAE